MKLVYHSHFDFFSHLSIYIATLVSAPNARPSEILGAIAAIVIGLTIVSAVLVVVVIVLVSQGLCMLIGSNKVV